MTEFPALEVFRHRYRDARFFIEGVKQLGFTPQQFKVVVCPSATMAPCTGPHVHVAFAFSPELALQTDSKHIKFHIVQELSPVSVNESVVEEP